MQVILQRNQKRATKKPKESYKETQRELQNKLEESSNQNRGNLQTTGRPLTARGRNAIVLVATALAVSVLMTWPLASGMGHLGRTQNSGDGRFAVWNVAWVAHALTTSPADLFDANIFYPHRRALAFSEANIGAGTLAVPIWAATHNPFAAHNSVVLMAFSASVIFTWLLVRRLTGDGAAAAAASILFAFCPYVFAHTAHIQLLMVAGIPLSLLAFHRLVDAPSPQRGVTLGLALAAQAMSCAYYGVSVGLTIGYATLFYAWSRRLWTTTRYWIAIVIAAASSLVIVVPFFLPFLAIQEETGFARSLDDARQWSAYVRSYLASGSHAHAWLLPLIRDWNAAVLFPGFLSIGLGLAGAGDRPSRAERPRRVAAAFPRPRNGDALYLDRDPDVLGVARSASRLVQPLLRHNSDLFVPARARAHGYCRHALPRRSRGVCPPRALPALSGPPARHRHHHVRGRVPGAERSAV